MNRLATALLLTIVALQAVVAPLVSAAEVTRAEYVERSEPICKANTIANRGILKGVRQDVREGKLRVAGGKFKRAARALERTIDRLERLPKPSADETRLERWFTHLNGEAKLLEKVARRLSKGSHVDLDRYVLELRHNANVTNNIVLTFGFEFCLIQTARYI
ncbi:MAG: hypothetical protein ACTHNP_02110 [Solirubrobacterales bacterium]